MVMTIKDGVHGGDVIFFASSEPYRVIIAIEFLIYANTEGVINGIITIVALSLAMLSWIIR